MRVHVRACDAGYRTATLIGAHAATMCLTRTCAKRTLRDMELRAWLAQKETTPSAFARELNLSHSTITRMLNGKAKPSAQVVERVFVKTGGQVTANDLFNQAQAGG